MDAISFVEPFNSICSIDFIKSKPNHFFQRAKGCPLRNRQPAEFVSNFGVGRPPLEASRRAPATGGLVSKQRRFQGIGDGCTIQHVPCRLGDPGKNPSNFAGFLGLAVGTAAIGDAAQTGQRRDRPIDDPQNLPVGDLVRRHQQAIAAKLAPPTVDNAVALHFKEDLLEKLPRNFLAGGDLADHERVPFPGESHQRAESIFCFLRYHRRKANLESNAYMMSRVYSPSPVAKQLTGMRPCGQKWVPIRGVLTRGARVPHQQAMAKAPKTLHIKTFGCQMNAYDSERMAEALGDHGYIPIGDLEAADLIILNTCHIREKAAEKVYSELGRLR